MNGLTKVLRVGVLYILALQIAYGFGSKAIAEELGAGANANVAVMAIQPDGKILLGGGFTSIHGKARSYLARLNTDGSLDQEFRTGVDVENSITSIAIQSDGKILVGGYFSRLGAVPRSNLGRLNTDGSVDLSFNPAPDDAVIDLHVLPNNQILIAGIFGNIQGNTVPVGLVRLNPNGTHDPTFEYNGPPVPASIAQQPNGKILVGPFADEEIVRINENGGIDSTFSAYVEYGGVRDIAVQADGKILIAGSYNKINGVLYKQIARLNSDGSLDLTFNIPSSQVGYDHTGESLLPLPGGKVIAGGDFYFRGESTSRGIARFMPDGSIDSSFLARTSGAVSTLIAQPDNKVILGGNFGELNANPRGNFGRINTNGSLDTLFPLKGSHGNVVPPILLLLDN